MLEELSNIKLLGKRNYYCIVRIISYLTCKIDDTDKEYYFGARLEDVWRGNVKKDINKQYINTKPKNVGIKFKSDNDNINNNNIEPEKKKIKFFERFEK